MEAYEKKTLNRLLEEDIKLKEIYDAHHTYGKQIAKLEKKKFLTEEEEKEKKKLKKIKLSMKDEMERIIAESVGRA